MWNQRKAVSRIEQCIIDSTKRSKLPRTIHFSWSRSYPASPTTPSVVEIGSLFSTARKRRRGCPSLYSMQEARVSDSCCQLDFRTGILPVLVTRFVKSPTIVGGHYISVNVKAYFFINVLTNIFLTIRENSFRRSPANLLVSTAINERDRNILVLKKSEDVIVGLQALLVTKMRGQCCTQHKYN